MTNPGSSAYLLEKSGQLWVLSPGQKTILGREISPIASATSGMILLQDPSISKIHAYIGWDVEQQRWYMEDTSRNGTFLNGSPLLGKDWLQPGDQINMGVYSFQFGIKTASNQDATMEMPGIATNTDDHASSSVLLALLAIAAIAFCLYFAYKLF